MAHACCSAQQPQRHLDAPRVVWARVPTSTTKGHLHTKLSPSFEMFLNKFLLQFIEKECWHLGAYERGVQQTLELHPSAIPRHVACPSLMESPKTSVGDSELRSTSSTAEDPATWTSVCFKVRLTLCNSANAAKSLSCSAARET